MHTPKDKRTSKNLEAFFIAVLKLSLNEQVKSNVLPFLKWDHIRDTFNDFKTFLRFLMIFKTFIFYIDFIAILVYYCVNKILTDGITF